MKQPFHLILTASVALLSTLGQGWADDAVEIKQHWTPGKTYSYTETLEQQMDIPAAGGQTVAQKANNTMDLSISVREDAGKKRLTLRRDRVIMNMDVGGKKKSFDSATDKSGAGGPATAMLGKEIKVDLDEKDAFSDVENFDEIAAAVKAVTPPGRFNFTKESIGETVKQEMLQAIPDHPVKPGDQWPMEQPLTFSGAGKATMKGNYVLKSVATHDGARCAEIAIDAKLTFEAPAAASANPQMTRKFEDTTINGTIWFDLDLGVIRESELPQNITLVVGNPADPTKTQRIPIKQVIGLKLSKVEDLK